MQAFGHLPSAPVAINHWTNRLTVGSLCRPNIVFSRSVVRVISTYLYPRRLKKFPKAPHTHNKIKPQCDKTNNMACAPSEDPDQHRHPPSLIRVFAMRFMGSLGPKPSSGEQRRLLLWFIFICYNIYNVCLLHDFVATLRLSALPSALYFVLSKLALWPPHFNSCSPCFP